MNFSKLKKKNIFPGQLHIGKIGTKKSFDQPLSPDCPKCQEENLSADHLFSCPGLTSLRISLKRFSVLKNDPKTIEDTTLCKSGLFPLI